MWQPPPCHFCSQAATGPKTTPRGPFRYGVVPSCARTHVRTGGPVLPGPAVPGNRPPSHSPQASRRRSTTAAAPSGTSAYAAMTSRPTPAVRSLVAGPATVRKEEDAGSGR